jgi:LacI family transcriptional regulator
MESGRLGRDYRMNADVTPAAATGRRVETSGHNSTRRFQLRIRQKFDQSLDSAEIAAILCSADLREPGSCMAGLQDIADELGVSVSLVSKVLNNRFGTTGASPQTIAAIREQAIRLGYRKNASAAALATGRQNAFGVFLHQLGEPGSGLIESLLQGIADAARDHHQRLVLHFFRTGGEFNAFCRSVDQHLLDGALVGGVTHRELAGELKHLQQRNVPVVTIYDQPLDPQIPNVDLDQGELARLATVHLIEQGCRRIVHLLFNPRRYVGYELALRQANLPLDETLVYRARSFKYQAGVEAVTTLLEKGVAFDGLVAQSDQQAVGAIHALLKAGLRVPEDVRVTGIDNSPYCNICIVPLTSVSQQMASRGREAVRLLLSSRDGDSATPVAVSPVLHVRQSSGNP